MRFPANRITWSNYWWACTLTPPGKWVKGIHTVCWDLRQNVPLEN